MKTVKAFYFANEDRKLRFRDNREIVVGETHSVEGEIETCYNGLHASERLIDALNYAPGCILYHVELSGDMDHHDDKLAARHRKYLAEFDATEVLKEFARKQALINIELIKPYYSEEEYSLIVKFLETGDESLRDAVMKVITYSRSVVCYVDAAWGSVRSAVWRDDFYASAYSSVGYAADAAADAAYAANAANAETQEDFKTKHDEMLTQMIKQATGWDI